MRKIIIFAVCMFMFKSMTFAQDATIQIVKQINSAPSVMLQDGTMQGFDNTFKNRFFKMLIGDFKVTTYFDPIEQYVVSDYDKDPISNIGEKSPNLILQYKLYSNQNDLNIKVKLVNAGSMQIRFEKNYTASDKKMYPFLSHKIISDINDNLGFASVSWMKRYVLVSKNVAPKQSDIVLSDYTLTYEKTLVSGGLNLFPKWTDATQSAFYYVSYSQLNPTLYKRNLNSKSKEKIISSQGMLVASDVSEDGSKILLTMAPNGQPDIYMYNVLTKNLQQITHYKGIDVNGGFIDHDKKIIFISDRLGYPNVFSKGVNSRGVEQMVYHGRNNNAATSHGNYIVYSSRDKQSEFGNNTFNLYLISTNTEYIRQLTATGKNLFPRFSDTGDTIAFIKSYGAQSALGIIRLNENKTFHFPLHVGKIQSIDW